MCLFSISHQTKNQYLVLNILVTRSWYKESQVVLVSRQKKLRNVSKLGYNINIFIVAVNQYYSLVTCYNSTLRRTTSYETNAIVKRILTFLSQIYFNPHDIPRYTIWLCARAPPQYIRRAAYPLVGHDLPALDDWTPAVEHPE